MKSSRLVLLALSCILMLGGPVAARAENALTIAAGAGYKKLVEALGDAYAARTGVRPQRVYGNMGQVVAQARRSGEVDLVVGDKSYLDGSGLEFVAEYPVGTGRLMLVAAKGLDLPELDGVEVLDAEAAERVLTAPSVTRIALPDAKKAIYGRAATQFLAATGLAEPLQSRLIMVGTVPQVSAYVISGEVDFGFVNLTDALAIKGKIARIIPVDEALYGPIRIVGKTLTDAPHPDTAADFGEFLNSDEARAIAIAHGL